MVRALLAVAAVLALVAVVLVTVWGLQRRLIYFPSGSVPPVSQVLPDGREVVLETGDETRLGAWLVPARGSDMRVAVLVANGNAGNRAMRAPLADALADRGLTVLLFDYRGYGGNAGSPTEDGLVRDARAARRFLVEQEGFPAERVVYFGESLGAAVVTALARDEPPGALVLRSPFTDLAAVGREHYPWLPVGALLKDRYPLEAQLRDVRVPVTVVYGSADSVVPPQQSRAVADAAPNLADVVVVPGADHNDPGLLDSPAIVDAVVSTGRIVGGAGTPSDEAGR